MSPSPDPRIAKLALRRHLRTLRKALPALQRRAESEATCVLLANYLAGRPLIAYWSLAEELSLAVLIQAHWQTGEPVWLPRVTGPGALTWHPVLAASQLRPDMHGIQAPDPTQCPATDLPAGALMAVPGVGFTAQGGRLGLGGGFYDRWLSQARAQRCEAVGVGFSCQLVEQVPLEAHDQSVDRVVIGGTWV